MLRRFAFLAVLFAALSSLGLLLAPLHAQTTFGRISGTVTDPSGASVVGATVVIRNTDTQATRTEKTDERGFYVAENLPIGPYAVEVNQPGFKQSTRSGFSLVTDGRVTADIKLVMGESTQSVDVIAEK